MMLVCWCRVCCSTWDSTWSTNLGQWSSSVLAQVHCTQHIVWSKQLAERLWRLSTTFPSSSHISLTHQVSTDCFHSFYWVVKEWTCSCESCWMILKRESFYISLHIFRVRTDLTCVTSHLRLSLELNRIESCGAPLTYRS